MCKWNTTTLVTLTVPNRHGNQVVSVDMCIAPIIQAFNDVGLETVASCCGHGKQPGRISLRNGKDIFIFDFEQAQKVTKMFPPIVDTAQG